MKFKSQLPWFRKSLKIQLVISSLLVFFSLLSVIFYQARWLRDVSNAFPFAVQERETWLITTLGCVLIVLGSLQGGLIRRALEQPFLLYLGRISYSLYLLQMIVLICVAPWIAAGLSEIGISSVGLIQFLFLVIISCISLPLADLSERFIEVPCIHLGKSLTTWLEDHSLIRKMRI
jgi:peptidoglycan/LPS O-acetylase OafA/YrhL